MGTSRFSKKMRWLRHPIEFGLAWMVLACLRRMSFRSAERIVRVLADIAYFSLAPRRRVAQANIRIAGIASEPAEVRRIARESFRHFAGSMLQSIKYRSVEELTYQSRIDPEAEKLLRAPGQGIILATGHLGNWEVAGQLLATVKPLVSVARKMNNPMVDRLVREQRQYDRIQVSPKHDADMGRFIAAIKRGEVLALMIDQYAGSRGMQVPFFGKPTSTHTMIALLHLVTRIPVCFGYGLQTGPTHYELRMLAPYVHKPTGDKKADIEAILLHLNRQLEDAVRQHPEQFMWAHRRWR